MQLGVVILPAKFGLAFSPAAAASITKKQGKADAAAVDAFFAQGYNNENLIDVILQVADKIAMNYVHNLTEVPVDFPLAPSLELAELSLN